MKKILILCLLLLPCRLLKAQINLVPNPSFEIIDTPCIYYGGGVAWQYDHMVGWWSALHSCDFFTATSIVCPDPSAFFMSMFAQPTNMLTFGLTPSSGNTYAGAFSFDYQDPSHPLNFREQLECTLTQALKINSYYKVKFKTAFFSPVNINYCSGVPPKKSTNIGIKFTNARYRDFAWSDVNDTIPSLNIKPDIKPSVAIQDTSWVEVSGIFRADSAYKYLILGTFGLDKNIDTATVPNGITYVQSTLTRKSGMGYYFFDDLSVTEIDTVFQNTSSPLASSFNASLLKDVVQINGKGEVYHIAIYDQLGGLKFELSTKDPITEINLKNYTFPGDVILIKVNSLNKIQTFKYINYEQVN